ncbi:MAG: sigma 54-interacting transcriptional regulator [Deltaproteobacteria bacterium]|nr:sigma 54-interacting transcriptional regulator [Deltaproteobacteria bacterium]
MTLNTRTLPIDESPSGAAARTDHLYLVVAGGKPGGGARWSLADIDSIEIGRGQVRSVRKQGGALRVDCPDPYMSSSHLRFERERAHWVVADAGSRNGILVDGAKQDRAIVTDRDVVEAGRSFFMLRQDEIAGPAELLATADPLTTLDCELAARFDELRRIAQSDIPVLVGGPTGTGKERVARAIHILSRRKGELVPVNCAALPATLVESELFGHKKGAFSGAISDAPGLVVASSGGTLFLDEIGDLPAPAQAALLRVLEEHEVRPVGATSVTRVDLRVVAATHRDLDAMIEDEAFREDLIARLSGFELELPALAERRVDLGAMLAEITPDAAFAAATIRALLAYAWPRNVRELVRALERAAALAGGSEITPAHLPEEIATAKFTAPVVAPPDARREELVALLEKHKGNVSKVAQDLGRVRQQVQRWLKRYGLDPERYRT